MKIVADANILAVENGFSDLGELQLIPGREISQQHLRDADILLVRSITPVNEALLRDSAIKLVATATSGSDHIDLDYLRAANIDFVDAKGCNANAVVDYCFAALAFTVIHKGLDLQASSVGIVGAGNVGGLLAGKLASLGVNFRLCDPPLAAVAKAQDTVAGGHGFRSLDETLDCDVLSLHVPLTASGDYPTRSLLNQSNLGKLKEGALLINSCRGSVVDEHDLLALLKTRDDLSCVIDVWEDEPLVNQELAQAVTIATPHIAGYSREAKLAATTKLSQAVHQHFGKSYPDALVPETLNESVILSSAQAGGSQRLGHWELILTALPLLELSASFKRTLGEENAAAAFDEFRKSLSDRREFRSHEVPAEKYSKSQQQLLRTLGFVLR